MSWYVHWYALLLSASEGWTRHRSVQRLGFDEGKNEPKRDKDFNFGKINGKFINRYDGAQYNWVQSLITWLTDHSKQRQRLSSTVISVSMFNTSIESLLYSICKTLFATSFAIFSQTIVLWIEFRIKFEFSFHCYWPLVWELQTNSVQSLR